MDFSGSTIERLRHPMPSDRLRGWLVTLGITALAAILRFWNLATPAYLAFDETYYAKDAWALLRVGYEVNWPENANAQVAAGNVNVYLDQAAFIVHPQLGKWLIALGEAMFGMNSFGWRFMPAVFGVLMIAVVIRLTRRLSRSTLVGGIAGLLLSLDGLQFVMSRLALLDIFQAFFLVAGVACVLCDRDWFRARLARHLERSGLPDLGGRFGPVVWFRPWRLAAGVAFGCAIGCKWNSAFMLAAMCVLSLFWDVGARRLAGARLRSWWAVLVDGALAFVQQVVVALGVYLATWWSWFASSGAWDRQWGAQHPDDPTVKLLGKDLASLLFYHKEISDFHNGTWIKQQTHPYSAHPGSWLLDLRPIGIDAVNNIQPGTGGCPAGGESCVQVISGIGTPALWWFAFVALFVGAIWWIGGRDWRFAVPLVAMLSIYIPWFFFADRALYFFYAVTLIPFTVINLALVLGKLLGPPIDTRRRQVGAIAVGLVIALVALNFSFFWPILTDAVIPRWQWQLRMWISNWI